MGNFSFEKSSVSKIVNVRIENSSVTTGAGLTGLAYNSASLSAYYIRPGALASASISLVTATVGTYVSGGFVEVDATNLPGVYQFSIPNACLKSGAEQCLILLHGATNMKPTIIDIKLLDYDSNSIYDKANSFEALLRSKGLIGLDEEVRRLGLTLMGAIRGL